MGIYRSEQREISDECSELPVVWIRHVEREGLPNMRRERQERTMTRAEQDADMTARLYDCRSAARGILGASYVDTLKPWRDLVARVMAAKRMTVLQAAIDIGKHIEPSDGLSLMLAFAASVEMIESPQATDAVDPVDRGSHV